MITRPHRKIVAFVTTNRAATAAIGMVRVKCTGNVFMDRRSEAVSLRGSTGLRRHFFRIAVVTGIGFSMEIGGLPSRSKAISSGR